MNNRTGLFRSRTDKMIAGVAGGIARTLNTDPSIIRVLFVILAIFGGGGVVLYLIFWIALPEDNQYYYPGQGMAGNEPPAGDAQPFENVPQPRQGVEEGLIVGVILIIVGGGLLAARILPRFHLGDYWPLILIIAGIAVIFTGFTGLKNK